MLFVEQHLALPRSANNLVTPMFHLFSPNVHHLPIVSPHLLKLDLKSVPKRVQYSKKKFI